MRSLAVCIPTYKRPEFLARCIRSAYAAAEGRPIRVVVCDDSADGTNVETMTALMGEHSSLSWHRNSDNLGIDRNIQRTVEVCESDVAWLIGEDDLFVAGAVARVHDRLQTSDPIFLFANYRYVDAAQSGVLRIVDTSSTSGPTAADGFVRDRLWMIGFIGGCVFDRRAFLAVDPTPYDGTYFTHVGRIVEMLAAAGVLEVEGAPCVSNRADGPDTFTWNKDAYGVFTGFERMCRTAAARCPTLTSALGEAVVAYQRQAGYLRFRTSVRLRGDGALDWRQFRAYLAHMRMPPVRKLLLLAVALAPRALLRPIVAAHRRRREGRSA